MFCVVILSTFLLPLAACTPDRKNELKIYAPNILAPSSTTEDGEQILSIKDGFEKYYREKTSNPNFRLIIEYYDNFDNITTKIERNQEDWDLVYMPDYTMEYLMQNNLLMQIDTKKLLNYDYVSDFIVNKYDEISKRNLRVSNLETYSYAIPHSWGTSGILFKKNILGDNFFPSWDSLWNPDLRNRILMKNSVRENYLAGQMFLNKTTLNSLYIDYITDPSKIVDLQNALKHILSDYSDLTMLEIEQALIAQKKLVDFRYDFDAKNGLLAEIYYMSLSLNSEASHIIDNSINYEETTGIFEYKIPKEGSNIWLEGWSMPKYAENIDASMEFMDYILNPSVAVRNMNYTKSTSVISSQETLDWLLDKSESTDRNTSPIDAGYFFTNLDLEESQEIDLNQLYIDHIYVPNKIDIDRCVLLTNFGSNVEKMSEILLNIKDEPSPNHLIIIFSILSAVFISFSFIVAYNTIKQKKIKNK